jgi:hypothetical protein
MRQDEELLEPQVERKLAATWPSQDARATVARYGTEPYEYEIERVRLAILKLSEGKLTELQRMTDAAKGDYRDVLMWAEYPEEGKALWSLSPDLTDEQRAELEAARARDRAQLDAWRRK